MLYYMIVYPRGDRTRLAVCQVRDYEKSEWALASRREFENTSDGEREANEYMRELASEYGLSYKGQQHYLD